MHISRRDRLFQLADSQKGYFTAKQAQQVGYAPSNHGYQVRTGKWVREYRGIYRLAHYPWVPRPDLMLWYLWSRNKNDVPQGVYSHDTALSLYEVSDINPYRLHMTVPRNFQKWGSIPKVLVLHRGEVPEIDVTYKEGVKVTRLVRTLVDLIIEQRVQRDIIEQALRETLNDGRLVSVDQLEEHPLIQQSKSSIDLIKQYKDLLT